MFNPFEKPEKIKGMDAIDLRWISRPYLYFLFDNKNRPKKHYSILTMMYIYERLSK